MDKEFETELKQLIGKHYNKSDPELIVLVKRYQFKRVTEGDTVSGSLYVEFKGNPKPKLQRAVIEELERRITGS